MKKFISQLLIVLVAILCSTSLAAVRDDDTGAGQTSLYNIPPRWLVDMPTAGTLPRGSFSLCARLYPDGGTLGYTDIGLSNRFMMGISFGGENVISNSAPNWNPSIEFGVKFRVIDELEFFPAISIGFSSQGSGAYEKEKERYTFKSRGFYAVASRSVYFYQWIAGWHAGINYSREYKHGGDKGVNFFGGLDATFKYNLAILLEWDAALDDNSDGTNFGGRGRGYLNMSVKWLFEENLELEVLLKDLLQNRRESQSITREIRLTYIDCF